MADLYQFIYTSVIAPQASPGCVSDIVRASRAANTDLDVTGLLVFDGWRFCQYLEGPEAHIRSLADKIILDPRHHQINILHLGPLTGPRRYAGWTMGYALASDESLLQDLETRQGPPAAAQLEAMLPRLDLEPKA